jgi:hypothetical protein
MCAAFGLASCSSRVNAPAVVPSSSLARRVIAAPAGGGPVLQMVYILSMVVPVADDLAEIAVYADGTIVTTTWAYDRSPASPTLHRGTISAQQLDAVVESIQRAGLGNDESTFIASGEQIADGSATLFVVRANGRTAAVWADQLDVVEHHRLVPERWAALKDLSQRLRSIESLATEPVVGDWTMRIEPLDPMFAHDQPNWPGPPFASAVERWGSGPQRCAIVAATVARGALAALVDHQIFIDQGVMARVSLRPLLPHEHTCSDTAVGNPDLLRPARS